MNLTRTIRNRPLTTRQAFTSSATGVPGTQWLRAEAENTARESTPSGERGFILIVVIFMAAMLLLALAVAAPVIAKQIQRQRELETIQRGLQYQHAIKLYYKKFGSYPTSIKQLLDTDNIRFLRQKYTDPLTGKDDWRIIHLGQAKVPPMGFFGKPLMGAGGPTAVGTPVSGANNGNFMNGAGGANGISGTMGMNGPMASAGNSSFGGTSNFGGASNFGGTGFGGSPASDTGSTFSPGGASAGATAGAGTVNGANPVSGSGSSGPDSAGSAFGGSNSVGPIVGVGLPVNKPSIIAWHKQTNYSKWEFVYWPIEDRMSAATSILGGAAQTMNGSNTNSGPDGNSNSPGNSNSGFGGNNSGFGNNNNFGGGNSGFGNNNSFGNSPTGASSNPGANNQP